MMKFKEFLEEEQTNSTIQALLEMSILMDLSDSLNESELYESAADKAHGMLSVMGLHAHKGKGLIDYFKAGAIGMGSLMIAAAKGDSEKIKEIAKSIKKTDVVDFLLKMDQATLHAVTGPIHMIDAITGWHIGAAVANHVEKVSDFIVGTITKTKEYINKAILNLKIRQKMRSNLDRLLKLTAQAT